VLGHVDRVDLTFGLYGPEFSAIVLNKPLPGARRVRVAEAVQKLPDMWAVISCLSTRSRARCFRKVRNAVSVRRAQGPRFCGGAFHDGRGEPGEDK
jgi:hypothetical protein